MVIPCCCAPIPTRLKGNLFPGYSTTARRALAHPWAAASASYRCCCYCLAAPVVAASSVLGAVSASPTLSLASAFPLSRSPNRGSSVRSSASPPARSAMSRVLSMPSPPRPALPWYIVLWCLPVLLQSDYRALQTRIGACANSTSGSYLALVEIPRSL